MEGESKAGRVSGCCGGGLEIGNVAVAVHGRGEIAGGKGVGSGGVGAWFVPRLGERWVGSGHVV